MSRPNTTYMAKPEDIKQQYFVIDAKDKVLGKVAAKAAHILRGKHKRIFTPHIDTGDYVIIINAEKVKITGNKLTDKELQKYTGFHSGRKVVPIGKLLARKPAKVLELAVTRMIPTGPIGYKQRTKLRVYSGETHPHIAQQPVTVTV